MSISTFLSFLSANQNVLREIKVKQKQQNKEKAEAHFVFCREADHSCRVSNSRNKRGTGKVRGGLADPGRGAIRNEWDHVLPWQHKKNNEKQITERRGRRKSVVWF